MKKLITLIGLSLWSVSVFAQQDVQFTQFMYNKLFMNPAYAGMKHSLCFTGMARQQWAGFDGAPKSGVFSGDCYIPKLLGGVGATIMYDQLGFETNTSYKFDYSYHRPLGNGVIALGLEMGVFTKRIGPGSGEQWMATTNWQLDPVVPPSMKKTVMDMGAGLWYENRRVWFGISSTHLNTKLINDGDITEYIPNNNPPTVNHPLLFQMARHYFITGGANLLSGNPWEIRPSFLVKSDGTATSVDLNVLAMYNGVFWFGASYRFKDAVCPMVGFEWTMTKTTTSSLTEGSGMTVPKKHTELKQMGTVKVGFAYDYTTSHLKNYTNGTFELFVNYCVPIKWPICTLKVNSERFFD